ncbi:MAG: hypothetical protein DI626_01125 [Micavibrio aeruginosavorus]|uniref:Uncharacterized protein n=1 Tax=Micavibrio aeruginosavorus TaxID=349221 RepID=A0A2W5A295_9BACT|nr:MAG: hypothetical protein DI626_01125 [Micavibrio aeruginosavorus]
MMYAKAGAIATAALSMASAVYRLRTQAEAVPLHRQAHGKLRSRPHVLLNAASLHRLYMVWLRVPAAHVPVRNRQHRPEAAAQRLPVLRLLLGNGE